MLLLDEPCVTDPARRMSRLHEGRLPVCPGDPTGRFHSRPSEGGVLDLRPLCDHHSRQVVEQALDTLGRLRGLEADHPAVRLHLLTSLTSQSQALLPDTMLDADSLGYHLNEIIVLLNLT